jgi:L-histidine N-alpha-methyltransferase
MATRTDAAVRVVLTAADRARTLAADARSGLARPPRSLPSKWLYDGVGCALFDTITTLEEYYPSRAERAALVRHADDIARASAAETLVELGSGTSTKTRLLIEALHRHGTLRRFVAFDVAEETLRAAVATLGEDYPCLEVAGVVADFESHLEHLPGGEQRMVAFLGGTIGNLDPPGRRRFLGQVASELGAGEELLLGVDLVKDPGRLIAAYDDREGVTEAFEKNALAVLNRELRADFDLARFAYRASWSESEERIEMGLVARGAQQVRLDALDLVVELDDGEEIRTEVSAKFRLEGITAELADAGLPLVGCWSDPDGDFALLLARRADRAERDPTGPGAEGPGDGLPRPHSRGDGAPGSGGRR